MLDEADKLFEMGFMEQVDALLAAATHPQLVRALFSATLPERVEELARWVGGRWGGGGGGRRGRRWGGCIRGRRWR